MLPLPKPIPQPLRPRCFCRIFAGASLPTPPTNAPCPIHFALFAIRGSQRQVFVVGVMKWVGNHKPNRPVGGSRGFQPPENSAINERPLGPGLCRYSKTKAEFPWSLFHASALYQGTASADRKST